MESKRRNGKLASDWFPLLLSSIEETIEHEVKGNGYDRFHHMNSLISTNTLFINSLVLLSHRSLLGSHTLLALLQSQLLGMSELLERSSVVEVGLLGGSRIGTNSLVGIGVDVLQHIAGDSVLDVARELLLVQLGILLLQSVHVVGNGLTEDLVAVSLSVVLLVLTAVTVETLVAVGNIQTTIVAALQHGEHASTGRGAAQTHIQVAAEGTLLAQLGDVVRLLLSLASLDLSVDLLVALVHLGHAQLGQQTASAQQTRAVSSGVVGQTQLHSVTRKLSGGGGAEHTVSNDLSRNDLSNHLVVGDTGHESVLGGVVLVLGLDDQSLTSVVVGLSL